MNMHSDGPEHHTLTQALSSVEAPLKQDKLYRSLCGPRWREQMSQGAFRDSIADTMGTTFVWACCQRAYLRYTSLLIEK